MTVQRSAIVSCPDFLLVLKYTELSLHHIKTDSLVLNHDA